MKKLLHVEVGTEDNQSSSTEGLLFIDGVVNYFDQEDKLMDEWEVKEFFQETYGETLPDLVDNTEFHTEKEIQKYVADKLHLESTDFVTIV
ncbi:hypothetical protein [Priestia flexa]|uniref:hypothetical protein n=1 Tax=Priestia flexa TaxID=86664 RepID=UPI0013D8CB6F|nr:hypothetical protein [Priestia flexa]